MVATGDVVEDGQLESQIDASVGLPASLFGRIDDRANVGLFFAFYEASTLFPVSGGASDLPRRRVVGSQVIAATVGTNPNL